MQISNNEGNRLQSLHIAKLHKNQTCKILCGGSVADTPAVISVAPQFYGSNSCEDNLYNAKVVPMYSAHMEINVRSIYTTVCNG